MREVVAINTETGEEIASAEDTHELSIKLRELEYDEENALLTERFK